MNRKTIILSFIGLFITTSIFSNELIFKKADKMPVIQNHSYLSQEYVGTEQTVTGLLSVNKNSFVLTENPSSRSKVTFVLEVKKLTLKWKLRRLNGKTVQIKGVLQEASSTWTKKLRVLTVQDLSKSDLQGQNQRS